MIPRDKEGNLSIVIGQDNLQRPSGEAFVTFASVEDCMKGLTYHLKNMKKLNFRFSIQAFAILQLLI